MSVKVAVRVRPFNEREKQQNPQCCVRMNGPQTVIIDPETKAERPFTFDYSFWSHDGFRTDDDGLMIKTEPHYSDQDDVYKALGQQVLDNAWEGYNCCLFAYGQTGAGKSYSMIGYGHNIGIVPIACNEIFQRVRKLTSPTKRFEVYFSMLEIYNEQVQDLLIDINLRPKGGLKIREHKTLGVYVQDLSKHPVDSYQAIADKMEEGQMNRTIGSTQMNATSSRAHTVITIEFKQIDVMSNGVPSERFSVINLVDLAGSEKAGATGATGDRLKEGAQINLSLTCLGRCINVLAEKASGKKKGEIVPFRDSSLTRILQNALGGNSKTIMICAISPAFLNYEETLSTLRYADNAKKIKNNAVINESVQDKLIRELKEENAKLKEMLVKLSKAAKDGGSVNLQELGLGNMGEIIEDMQENEKIIEDFQKPWAEKLAEAKEKRALEMGESIPQEEIAKIDQKAEENKESQQHLTPEKIEAAMEENPLDSLATESPSESLRRTQTRRESMRRTQTRTMAESKDKTVPHLINLHEDPQLSGIIYYSLSSGQIVIGRKGVDEKPPEIILGAIGIKQNHSKINLLPNGLFELTCIDSEAAAVTLVNGKFIPVKKKSKILNHLDRICFAGSAIFVFHYPLLAQTIQQTVETNAAENIGVDANLQKEQAWEQIYTSGIPNFELGTSSTQCPGYKNTMQDIQAVNWDTAFKEVEEADKAKHNKEKTQKEMSEQKAKKAKEEEIANQLAELDRIKKQNEEKLRVELQQLKEVQEGQRLLAEKKMQELEAAKLQEDQQKYEMTLQLQQQLEEQHRLLRLKDEQHRKELADQLRKFQFEEKQQEVTMKKQEIMIQIKSDIQPDIEMANEIAANLGKNITFSSIISSQFKDENQFGDQQSDFLTQRKEKLEVKVEDFDQNMILIWTPEKFREKFLTMKGLWEQYGDRGLSNENDLQIFPSKQEAEPILIGECYYKLEGLSMLIDNPISTNLIGSNYAIQGKIEINLIPTDASGIDPPPEEMITDNPEDLIDNRLDFLVQITKVKDLPEDLCRDVFVEYSFYLDQQKHRTVVMAGKCQNPEFNYSKHHTVENVTEMLVRYLEKEFMTFKVYGFADVKQKQKKDKPDKPQAFANKFNMSGNSSMMNESTKSDISDNLIVVQEKVQPIKKDKQSELKKQSTIQPAAPQKAEAVRRPSAQLQQPPTQNPNQKEKDCTIF